MSIEYYFNYQVLLQYPFIKMTDGDNFTENFMESFSADESNPKASNEKLAWQQQESVLNYNKNIFNSMIAENRTRPVRVQRVNVVGCGKSFRDSFLQRQLEPLLNNNKYLTMQDFLKNVDLTTANFTKTNTVRDIGLSIATPQTKSPFTSMDTLEIIPTLNVLPVKRFFMKVGTDVGNGEGDGYLALQWKNIFGGGEFLSFDTSMSSNRIGARNRSQNLVSYSMPIMNSPNLKWTTIGYQSSRLIDYTTYHEEFALGLTNRISTNYYPAEKKLNHELSFENLLRVMNMVYSPNNYRGNSLINDFFLLNAGHSLKSSLTYSVQFDSRDSPTVPHQGQYIKLSNELSLLPGNRFIKTCLDSVSAYPVSKTASVNFSLKSGIIHKFSINPVNPLDKFHLGGPNDMRGFMLSGMGPKQMGMSIGGDAFFAAGASLINKIPYAPEDSNFKMHSFINTGKLINLSKNTYLAKELTTNVDMSIGFGVVYAHPAARLELNYVLPIVAHQGEEVRTGLQWGIGLSFL